MAVNEHDSIAAAAEVVIGDRYSIELGSSHSQAPSIPVQVRLR
jgi:hypothetical protein